MLSEEQNRKILSDLEDHHYSIFSCKSWNVEFRDRLTTFLKAQSYQNFTFYKVRSEKNSYLVILDSFGNEFPVPVELEYAKKRGILKIIVPFIIAMMTVFLTVFLIQSDLIHIGDSSPSRGIMIGIVVMLVPIVIGAFIEYLLILRRPRKSLWRLSLSALISLIFIMLVSVVVFREGTICLVMIGPLAAVGALIGAALIQMLSFYFWKPTAKIYSLALLPLLLYLVLPDYTKNYFGQTQREIIIHAPQDQVFRAINLIGHIQPEEVPNSFIFTIGFPKPIFGMTEQRSDGVVRTIQWERGVQFEERVKASHAPYLLSWDYQFNKNSFPKGSLDDHVEVGGQYFDLLKTDYQLERIDAQTTKLILTIDYRVSTEFNWYSKLWIDYVLGEFSDVVMTIHKNRLEH